VAHQAFVMNIAAARGHLPPQWAVFCRQCSNTGNPKMIVKPNGVALSKQVAFIKRHNKGYK
jgi:hypothetical protein